MIKLPGENYSGFSPVDLGRTSSTDSCSWGSIWQKRAGRAFSTLRHNCLARSVAPGVVLEFFRKHLFSQHPKGGLVPR
jgi:hypothetical protein